MSLDPTPVTLEGRIVRLEPLRAAHAAALAAVALDPDLWRWTASHVETAADLDRYVAAALGQAARGEAVPFAVVARATGAVVGSTRFAALAPEHGRAEIGWTFYGRAWQGTGVNAEAKRLLLAHAFETGGLRRVEFKTDALNAASRAALTKLGAREEGTLRAHLVTETGRVRDTVYFSILAGEWPAVRDRLDARIAAAVSAGPTSSRPPRPPGPPA